MKVKLMGIKEILRRIWLFPANKIKSSGSGSEQLTQLIIAAHNCHKCYVFVLMSRFGDVKKFEFLPLFSMATTE